MRGINLHGFNVPFLTLACSPGVKVVLSNQVEHDNSCRYTEASASVEAAVRVLNPGAEVIKTTRAQVPIELVLRTGKFDLADASNGAGWLQRIRGQNKEVWDSDTHTRGRV